MEKTRKKGEKKSDLDIFWNGKRKRENKEKDQTIFPKKMLTFLIFKIYLRLLNFHCLIHLKEIQDVIFEF